MISGMVTGKVLIIGVMTKHLVLDLTDLELEQPETCVLGARNGVSVYTMIKEQTEM